jgi:hypothetical protein
MKSPIESVLEQRELIGVIAQLVQDSVGQCLTYADSLLVERLFYDLLQLFPGGSWNQILTPVKCFGKISEPRTFTQKIGTHGKDYVD